MKPQVSSRFYFCPSSSLTRPSSLTFPVPSSTFTSSLSFPQTRPSLSSAQTRPSSSRRTATAATAATELAIQQAAERIGLRLD